MNAVMDNIAEVFKINSDKKNVEFTKKKTGKTTVMSLSVMLLLVLRVEML